MCHGHLGIIVSKYCISRCYAAWSHYWLRYLPEKNVLYPCACMITPNVYFSGPDRQASPLQLPGTELFVTPTE